MESCHVLKQLMHMDLSYDLFITSRQHKMLTDFNSSPLLERGVSWQGIKVGDVATGLPVSCPEVLIAVKLFQPYPQNFILFIITCCIRATCLIAA